MSTIGAALGFGGVLGYVFACGGYWLTMRDARVGAGFAAATAGLALTLPLGLLSLVGAAVGAAAGVAVGTTRPRLGWSVAAGAGGLVVGTAVAGASLGSPVAVGAGVVVGGALAGLAWRFPRAGVPLGTTAAGAVFAAFLPTVAGVETVALWNTPAGAGVTIGFATFLGLIAQPWVAELGDEVPPLFPLFFRRWFDLVPEGGVNDALCPNCGTDVDPTAAYCSDCDASLVGMVGPADGAAVDDATTAEIPAGAVAVDVACPHCGERPIEERATGVGLLGLLVIYRWKTRSFVGCHQCNRSKLFRMAGKNAVLGWWSITALVNPFAIAYDVGRGLYNTGPSEKLARSLDGAGIDYEWLTESDAYDPSSEPGNELMFRGILRLGMSVALADGSLDRAEAVAMRDAALELFEGRSPESVESRLDRYAGEVTNADKVAAGLSDMLTLEGKTLALVYAARVAAADGVVSDDERVLLGRIANGLGLDPERVDEVLGASVSAGDDSNKRAV
ncbi:TerB family tellurite resistance protein [Haloarchaeobius sp. TZWWS8]|uniref:TerB family tellurite resistance protein n=1 Tax=Haloarchaeobius sp. TZWWS8 TaxID=3446121 RepID=UPI003EC12656